MVLSKSKIGLDRLSQVPSSIAVTQLAAGSISKHGLLDQTAEPKFILLRWEL